MEEEGEITKIVSATTTSKSLRATIPIGIVRQFKITVGDQLRWSIRAEENKLVIVVEPIKSSEKKTK